MTPEQPDRAATWRLVNDVFHRALDLTPDQRAAFVQRECAHDAAIRDEVLSLLAAHDRADDFLDQPASTLRQPGNVVGQYRIAGVLGEGGMGVVYQAEDLRLGRLVALKAIPSALAGDPARRERLRREARTAAALTHAGIATVYAFEEFGDELFIAGEFVDGETLRDEIGRGPAADRRVLDTAVELAAALAAAHDRGIIHRDLKPENVVRTPSGHVKILDFGLARMRDLPPELAQLTGDGKVFGTPGYMSPEQIRNEQVDARSDLFALGIVLHELLTGAHPFGAAEAPVMIARILGTEPAPLDGGLGRIIGTLLQKAPAARFRSAHELLAVLERVRSGESDSRGFRLQPEDSKTDISPGHALWWWKFHQAAVSISYVLLLIPTWSARHWLHNQLGSLVFLVAAVAAGVAITLRLHLWFAAHSMPAEWRHQHAKSSTWLRAADVIFGAALATAGIAVLEAQSLTAVVLVTGGVLAILFSAIVEPTTTRAAFGLSSRSGPAD